MALSKKAIPALFDYETPATKVIMCLSTYTGYPVVLGIHDVTYMAMHCSKHNLIKPGYTPTYENGRIVSLIKDDGTDNRYFTYDDGTGQR